MPANKMPANTRTTPAKKTQSAVKRVKATAATTATARSKHQIKTSTTKTKTSRISRFNANVANSIISIAPKNSQTLYNAADRYLVNDNHRAIGRLFGRYYNDPTSKFTVTFLDGRKEVKTGKDLSQEALQAGRYEEETNYYVSTRIQNDTSTSPYTHGNAFIYARVSVKNDASQSIEAQLHRTTAYVRDNLMATTKIFVDDGKSARDMKNLKNELGYWINDVYFPNIAYFKARGANLILIVDKVDRLSRNVAKGIDFIRRIVTSGGEVHFVSDGIVCTKDNWLPLTKFKVVEYLNRAEQESDTISERVRRSYEYRRAKTANGGYTDDDDETDNTNNTDSTDADTENTDDDDDTNMTSQSDDSSSAAVESDFSYEQPTTTDEEMTTTDEDTQSEASSSADSTSSSASSKTDAFESLITSLTDAINGLNRIQKYYKKK